MIVHTLGFFLQGQKEGLLPNENLALVNTVERVFPKRAASGHLHTSRDIRDSNSEIEMLQKDCPWRRGRVT